MGRGCEITTESKLFSHRGLNTFHADTLGWEQRPPGRLTNECANSRYWRKRVGE